MNILDVVGALAALSIPVIAIGPEIYKYIKRLKHRKESKVVYKYPETYQGWMNLIEGYHKDLEILSAHPEGHASFLGMNVLYIQLGIQDLKRSIRWAESKAQQCKLNNKL